jgi:hypothetical protein
MPSPSKSGASRAQQRLRIAAVLVAGVGLMAGVFLGVYIGAITFTVPSGVDQAYRVTNMNQQPVKLVAGQARAFNWMMFLLVFGPSVISSAILFSGAEVCGAVARRTRTRTSSGSPGGGDTITLGD